MNQILKPINSYGCTICQTVHFDGQRIYDTHLLHQSKHGLSKVLIPEDIKLDKCPGSQKPMDELVNGKCSYCGRIFQSYQLHKKTIILHQVALMGFEVEL